MNLRTLNLALVALISFLFASCTSNKENAKEPINQLSLKEICEQNLKEAADNYSYMATQLPAGQFPKTFIDGKLETSGSDWWCSGFYPGALIYLYQNSKDTTLLNEAKRMLHLLEKEQYNTSTHDLGFMMFCSYGNALQVENDSTYKSILINSAKSLSSRFNPKVGCIKSWDSKPEDFLVIIDNMMNLELLFWATQETGDSSYYNIAVTHANTTLKNHFRSDNSSYHVLNYNAETGAVQEKKTAQGYADSSAWARGQSWGLYGYTSTYRLTKDKAYLDQAVKIADFLLQHPNLPEDKIPYWDYNAPDIPNAPRDASAAAIMASALLELKDYVQEDKAQAYVQVAETIIRNLSADHYRASPEEVGGFILKHSVGHKPAGSEIDVPITYADYYYIEAMKRYLND
ncbi:glycoside hydrolase family 88 protein [Fulvivirga ligni]|uniref:glycoside hydrolase family 88 protein n=1 Tax=Fulvivirga ligni TaxID=2904246 RepID=UPI001F1DDA99|nr:glycoside hydrolase family 88 protein [Fulvivirga ligni]UII18948.1 glycoside hydrolase family 88 protein [Fulvivirga ligni]